MAPNLTTLKQTMQSGKKENPLGLGEQNVKGDSGQTEKGEPRAN